MAQSRRRSKATRRRVSKALLDRVMCGDRDVIQNLGEMGSRAVPHVLKAFNGPYPADSHPRDVYEYLMWALSLAVEEDAGPMLEILNGVVPGDEGLAVCTIGKSRDPRVPDALIVALNHKNSFVREHAAEALIIRREANALDALLPRICDRSTSVGSTVVFGILSVPKF